MRSVARVTVYLRRGDLRNEVIVRERSAEKGWRDLRSIICEFN